MTKHPNEEQKRIDRSETEQRDLRLKHQSFALLTGHTLSRGLCYNSGALITMWLTSSGLGGQQRDTAKVKGQCWDSHSSMKGGLLNKRPRSILPAGPQASFPCSIQPAVLTPTVLNSNSMQGQLPYYRKNKENCCTQLEKGSLEI